MSDFCGAWTLGAAPAAPPLDATTRGRLLAALPGRDADTVEVARGRLWLAGPRARLRISPRRCEAHAGFMAAPSAGGGPAPDGHYALAAADERELTLFRDPSGEERLYYARVGETLLFSSSLKPLLAHAALPRSFDGELFVERALGKVACFGAQTLLAGVEELLCGHELRARETLGPQRWSCGDLLSERPPEAAGNAPTREALGAAVRACIGQDRRVAVSLSGGVDSAAVAALAADAVGPGNVEAFTYEFADARHPSETAEAAAVARSLGLARHHVLSVDRSAWLDSRLAAVWWSEDIVDLDKAFLPLQERQLRERGFSKVLTGDGVGSRLEWFDALGRWLPRAGPLDWTLAHWRFFWRRPVPPPSWLGAVLPAAAPPFHFLYFPVLAVLGQRGLVRRPERFFPPALREAADRLRRCPRVSRALEEGAGLPLAEQLARLAFGRGIVSLDLARPGAAARRRGMTRLAPAAFGSCARFLRRQGADKPALRSLLQGRVPGALLRRPKRLLQAVPPLRWHYAYERPLRLDGLPAPFNGRDAAFAAPFVTGNLHLLTLWRDALLRRQAGGAAPRWSELDGGPEVPA